MALLNMDDARTQLIIYTLINTILEKLVVVLFIYQVFYMGWSLVWLLAPVILTVALKQFKDHAEQKRKIAAAKASEEETLNTSTADKDTESDIEHCDWINKLLKQIWPYAKYQLAALIREEIEPKIALELNGFRFDYIALGSTPPRIDAVKIYEKKPKSHEIMLDLKIAFPSDCNIAFFLGGVKGGIQDIYIGGWIRVVMKPLLRTKPLLGGFKISFLNKPHIDFSLYGLICVVDFGGLLSESVRIGVIDKINEFMVQPNELTFSLTDEVVTDTRTFRPFPRVLSFLQANRNVDLRDFLKRYE